MSNGPDRHSPLVVGPSRAVVPNGPGTACFVLGIRPRHGTMACKTARPACEARPPPPPQPPERRSVDLQAPSHGGRSPAASSPDCSADARGHLDLRDQAARSRRGLGNRRTAFAAAPSPPPIPPEMPPPLPPATVLAWTAQRRKGRTGGGNGRGQSGVGGGGVGSGGHGERSGGDEAKRRTWGRTGEARRGGGLVGWAGGGKGTGPCSCRPTCLGGGPGTACSPRPCQPEPVGHRARPCLGRPKKTCLRLG